MMRAEASSKSRINLDPRTKMLLCLSVSVTLIAGGTDGVLRYFNYVLSLVPVAFLIGNRKYGSVALYAAVYLAAQGLVILLVPILPPVLNILFTGIIMFSTKLIPGGMMCWFLFSTTTVSEFIAVMDRMHVTKKISVPISVMFRFFPTIKEEYGYVQKAMRMREVGSLRNPIKMLEYRMVPFLMSVVSIGNDLSASALTRGLNAPCPRTNMCRIGFTWRDAVTFLAFLLFVSGYFAVLFLQRSVR